MHTRMHIMFCDCALLQSAVWPLLGLAWCATAVGRVAGDAHWVSDTIAAGFLALCAASLMSLCVSCARSWPSAGASLGVSKAEGIFRGRGVDKLME